MGATGIEEEEEGESTLLVPPNKIITSPFLPVSNSRTN
jgi:hypothetical protein